jgi:hypothetical protein
MFTRPTMLFVASALIAASACGGRSTSKSESATARAGASNASDDHAGAGGVGAVHGGAASTAGSLSPSAGGHESSDAGDAGSLDSGGAAEQGGSQSIGGESRNGGDGGAITDGGAAGSLASGGAAAQGGTPNTGGEAGHAQAGTGAVGGNSNLKCNPTPGAGPTGCAENQLCMYGVSPGYEGSQCVQATGTIPAGGSCVSFACKAGLACISFNCQRVCRIDHPEDCGSTSTQVCCPVFAGDNTTFGTCTGASSC